MCAIEHFSFDKEMEIVCQFTEWALCDIVHLCFDEEMDIVCQFTSLQEQEVSIVWYWISP